jgi:predicted small secreted protein
MSRSRWMLVALVSLFLLSACNTVEGFGRDVAKAGEQLEEAADEARN